MTLIWVFPVYPLLIIAPLAASLINAIPSPSETQQLSSQTILAGALMLQGIGFLVSAIIYSAFLYRLMTQGLPAPPLLPAMFVSVGPAGFTATGIIQLGTLASKALPHSTVSSLGSTDAVSMIIRVLALAAGLCLWGLTLWFFVLSVGGQWRCLFGGREKRPHFGISFYAFVFPNSALVSSTHAVGKALGWPCVQILGCVFAGIMIFVWVVVFARTGWGVCRGTLLCKPREEGEK
jgi:tellurite resistance protein TehA-like permease